MEGSLVALEGVLRETLERVSQERQALLREQETMRAEKRALEEGLTQLRTEQRKVIEERREVELMWQQLREDKNYLASNFGGVLQNVPISPSGNSFSISPTLFSGIKQKLQIEDLVGWTLVHCKPYSHATTLADFEPPEELRGGALLLGARRTGRDFLAVGAMGNADAITEETEGPRGTHFHNGVHWYCWRGKSIGFSPRATVTLHQWAAADEHDPQSPERLSWRLNGRGGYRAGTTLDLASSNGWEKLIFATALRPFR